MDIDAEHVNWCASELLTEVPCLVRAFASYVDGTLCYGVVTQLLLGI